MRKFSTMVSGTRAILAATEEYWPEQFEPIPLSEMQIILDEMFELGILGKIEHDHSPPTYCLRTRQVANMLGTEDEITEELIALQDVEPPLDYNPSTNRRVMRQTGSLSRVKDARHFSPLTDGQLRHLLHDEDVPGVRLVTGTPYSRAQKRRTGHPELCPDPGPETGQARNHCRNRQERERICRVPSQGTETPDPDQGRRLCASR